MAKVKAKAKVVIKEKALKAKAPTVRCPDCPWKAGLKSETEQCPTCEGTGLVAE